MKSFKTMLSDLLEKLSDYVETRMEIIALKLTDKATNLVANFLTIVILCIVFGAGVILLSIGAAILINNAMHSNWMGFIIMGILYIIVGLILLATKTKLIHLPILNLFIKAILEVEENAEAKIEKLKHGIEDNLNLDENEK